jgi:Ca2+/H+ antiporter
MGARFRSWRQQIKQHRVAIGVVAIVLIVVIVFIIIGYLFDWTGFNGYNKVTITHTISGTNAGTVTKTEEYQPGKGLWDWLQLLIIPAVLAVAGYVINLTISRGEQEATKQRAQSEQEAAEKRAKTEYEIALDNQREAALQEYIDKLAELLLEKKLRESKSEEDEVRKIACM